MTEDEVPYPVAELVDIMAQRLTCIQVGEVCKARSHTPLELTGETRLWIDEMLNIKYRVPT